MKGLTTMTTTTTTCARCEGSGEVRNWSLSAEQVDDHRTCPECHGSGDVSLRTPDATARRESAPPHGCTGARCETCGDDTPAANAVAQWEARVAEATAELAHARDGLLRAKGDDTPALIAWAVARLLRAASLRCAARVALMATTAEEWGDVATDAAQAAADSEYARHAYRAAAAMRMGDAGMSAEVLARATGHADVAAWAAHVRWCIADERNVSL